MRMDRTAFVSHAQKVTAEKENSGFPELKRGEKWASGC